MTIDTKVFCRKYFDNIICMLDGSSAPEITSGFAPPRVDVVKPPQNFTRLSEFERSAITEPPKYSEPTMIQGDKQLTDQLLEQIMNQEGPKKPQEAISQIEKKIPQEVKKSQGFFAQIIEWFKTTFRNLLR